MPQKGVNLPNAAIVGAPGGSNTLLAPAMAGTLSRPKIEEALDIARIHSAPDVVPSGMTLDRSRPFRRPPCSTGCTARTGGGDWSARRRDKHGTRGSSLSRQAAGPIPADSHSARPHVKTPAISLWNTVNHEDWRRCGPDSHMLECCSRELAVWMA